jgi:lycopene beta-cyclase
VRFRGRDFDRSIVTEAAPYALVRGEDFFRITLQELEERGAQFSWECAHTNIQDNAIMTDGGVYEFDKVVDASFEVSEARSLLWQSFGGLWVETQEDSFEPSTALLMDLLPSSESSPVVFVYVLPISAREALIEHTTFCCRQMPSAWHFSACEEWIRSHVHGKYTVTSREAGVIPMGLERPGATQSIVIGSAGGAIRASTGYAFLNIQKQARDLARALARGDGGDVSRIRDGLPRWYATADTLFLKALAKAPLNGSLLMGRLLHKAPAQPLVRFLAGEANIVEALRVMSSVPKIMMMRTLMSV